ncbi:MAG: hypothetical protein QF609_04605 [Gammaproteobacteria bacterium]|jgi:hypothetical protein|nr:hypothetical protein [Gammaproteobacteria bacterium]HJP36332.1 hypothetical protein [Gammaproteobacteria bacterium]
MHNKLMAGVWRYVIGVPQFLWEKQIAAMKAQIEVELGFMMREHRRVHHWVVGELPRAGGPLTPESIAASLDLPLDRVKAVLDDLEAHMTFLFRNPEGAVVWAYPVTVDETPHRVTFNTGERLYAA